MHLSGTVLHMTALRLAAPLALTALLLGLGACENSNDGDSGYDAVNAASAPRDATEADFCAVQEDFALLEPSVGEDVRGSETDGINWPERLAEVGTPPDMTDLERRGFELFVTTYDENHGTGEDFDWRDDLPAKEAEAWSAFYNGYLYEHCEPYGEHE